ncbi:hypothetical protein NZD88_05055 [Chryseobacterium antibioticum]|uniref:Uncharacterized protein n=1 Tax=Chryseobacterium pyrolae TaxID=2987481 RepID=A0ABT2IE59_9FLAO|nr:hypothetical protein [Chryseobacterium pyrolae]MCT2406920.1 hypothetical protein [Chryseobacterium pyrolae]
MKKNKIFTFKNVLPYHSVWTVFVIIPCLFLYASLYYFLFKGGFRLSLVSIFTLFYFVTCYLILKAISVQVKIWFNDQYLFIQKGNRKQEKYPKADVKGFYSYDYETKSTILQNSKVYFRFCLKNSHDIFINDVEYRSLYEVEKGENLKRFLKEAQKELNFVRIRKRNFQSSYWYSNQKNDS